MAQFAAPLMIASSAVQAGGALFSGEQQQKADNFNASMQRQQASETLNQSYLKAAQIGQQNAREQGAIRAAYGASGVTSSGTPLSVMLDQATKGEMNKRLALYQGRVDALSHLEQSDADIAQGHAARAASWINAGSSLLTGGSRVAMAQRTGGGDSSFMGMG